MHSRSDRIAAIVAFVLVALACFQAVLFRGEQFGYRDSSSYYYPLHARAVAQWKAGHVPLWDPDENGGLPLLGNPTAAVLYPAKLIFAAVPFAWASRLYLVGHVVLAFAAMTVCMRGFGISRTGAVLGGLSYGFGGPVLLQYCNAIYLVGSAWLPLGVLAADAWLRRGYLRAIAGLAVVLAMEILGGDIQIAYMTGLFTGLYAIWIVIGDRLRFRSAKQTVIAIVVWAVGVPFMAAWLPSCREWGSVGVIGAAFKPAMLAALGYGVFRLARDRKWRLLKLWGGLALAAAMGASLAGVQLFPVFELSRMSFRLSETAHMDPYGYSLEPYRLLEFIWPGIFGIEYPENRWWLLAIPPVDSHLPWVSTLYLGALPILLAMCGMRGGADVPAWRIPMIATVAIGLALSIGRFGSPLWWARCVPELSSILGAHGVSGSSLFRNEDGAVRDAFGSPYWMLSAIAPGLSWFRFPAKQLVFVSLGVSMLAGLGWDRIVSGFMKPSSRIVYGILGVSALVLLGSFLFQTSLTNTLTAHAKVASLAGPIDAGGAIAEVRRSVLHASLAMGSALLVMIAAGKGRRWSGAAAMILLAIDLSLTNSRYVWTIPQEGFEKSSRAANAIADAERAASSPSPFRIQRMPEWHPLRWIRTRSPNRLAEIQGWQRDTLQSGYGMLHGLQYTLTPGVIEPETFLNMFDPWTIPLEPPGARMLKLETGRPIRYYPRRAFDVWGSRYFILPKSPYNWLDPNRAIASFLPNTEVVAPNAKTLSSEEAIRLWDENEDWQILRNRQVLPRAWIVHDVRVRPPLDSIESADSKSIKRSLLYQGDPLWTIPGRPVENPRTTAWVQTGTLPDGMKMDGEPPSESESVVITHEEPGHIVMEAVLERDGLVVMSSHFYPGWKLTIDGAPSEILRTNLSMRGAMVRSGRHRLVYSYEPESVRIGLVFTVLGVIAILAFGSWKTRSL